jgi:hypothetical protein
LRDGKPGDCPRLKTDRTLANAMPSVRGLSPVTEYAAECSGTVPGNCKGGLLAKHWRAGG